MGTRASVTAAAAAAVASSVMALAGCGAGGSGAGGGASQPRGTVTVFAAASLTDAFTEVGEAFEERYPAATVEFSFAGSSTLREQVLAGAPADVYASADPSNMSRLVEAGAAERPQAFVTNRLQVAVPAGNPGGVTGLADFTEGDLLLGLCAEEVPCGAYGREALASAGVTPALDTNATDVRALLTQVASGDLDAGIVYRTDVLAAGDDVEGIDIPAQHNVVADYPIAVLTDAAGTGPAERFVEFVTSSGAAEDVLASYGFDPA